MAVRYDVVIESRNEAISITHSLESNTDTSTIPLEEISQIEKMCSHFNWSESDVSRRIGSFLYTMVNGRKKLLDSAITTAHAHGEPLQLFIKEKGSVPDLPFELLYDSEFLVPSKICLVRHVSNYGCEKKVEPKNRALKVLFMACSPEGISPVLNFEKEEETILEVTKDLPVDINVEDTGSLEGLRERLAQYYDVVHISGHADIVDGKPIFLMEDELGHLFPVTPSNLWDALKRNPPRLLFLSGCLTGQTPPHEAAVSFAHELVLKHSSTILGWGLPVLDTGAREAAKIVYFELSRGKSILEAVFSARQELYDNDFPDWSLLRLFSDGTPLNVPVVEEGQKVTVKARDVQYAFLQNSQVRVLEKGFVGRRRQIQRGIGSLKKDKQKVGLLLHGTGGLGKSCLAGKLCERFKDHALIVVRGELNDFTFLEAVRDAFDLRGDEGLTMVREEMDVTAKIRKLCVTSFQKENYLIILDNFEQNLEGVEEGNPVLTGKAAVIVGALLQYLPLACKMTQVVITSRYTFPLIVDQRDLVTERLEPIGLTSFRGADERKKVNELSFINNYPNPDIRQNLIDAGRGNPRLMEALNGLVMAGNVVDEDLLDKVKGEQEEFVQELILKEILMSKSQDFQKVIKYLSVYGLPVSREGIEKVCKKMKGWELFVDSGVQLSLIEKGKDRVDYYWVTPLLREELFEELEEDEQKKCHEAAVIYYKEAVSYDGYQPVYAFELIDHALLCGMDDDALEEGSRLLSYLRNALLYRDALLEGGHILSHISKIKRKEKLSLFLNEFGNIFYYVGDSKKAIKCFEQALEIDREIYGEKHPSVATMLNNLGSAWDSLGDPKKAIEYYEKALKIGREIYGEKHPSVATRLNNLGSAWYSLGDPKKAIEYYEKALKIDREIYGEKHPSVATDLSNLGLAWNSLGDPKKAIEYYEKALKIDREIYGEKHPSVATDLSNLGLAWNSLGDPKKAIEYYEKALEIDRDIYGEKHPSVATDLNNLGSAWNSLGDPKKAIEYYEQALSIVRDTYGDRHPYVAKTLGNLGMVWYSLGDPKKAIEYIQHSYKIFHEIFGDQHPDTRAAKEALDFLENKNT